LDDLFEGIVNSSIRLEAETAMSWELKAHVENGAIPFYRQQIKEMIRIANSPFTSLYRNYRTWDEAVDGELKNHKPGTEEYKRLLQLRSWGRMVSAEKEAVGDDGVLSPDAFQEAYFEYHGKPENPQLPDYFV
jgi:hypothetical protein